LTSLSIYTDYYDHNLGGLVIEAHVHGLPTPNVKFYKDNHLLHARKNKIVFFVENKEIFQCLMVRPDASVSGTYTILADNAAGKKRFNHHVDFETKYPLIHLPGMYHADKKLDDFVDEMLDKIPKPVPEQAAVVLEPEVEKLAETVAPIPEKIEVPEPPKPEEIAEALQAVVDQTKPAEEEPKPVEEAPKKKSKSKSKHKKKRRAESPKIDSDLVNDGEDEKSDAEEEKVEPYQRKFSTVVHEPYESETFRIYNAKQSLWFSGKLRNQTAIEGTTIKMICAVSGPKPIMKWTKNERPVPWSQTIRNLSGEGIGHVIIDKISRADAGVYTCSAGNEFNRVETSAIITVIPKSTVPKNASSKPFFTRVLGQFYHITEDDLILDAHVRAVPDPTIKWYKDEVELNAAMDDRYDFSSDHDGGYQLRIHKPVEADCGTYTCEAINESGKAKVFHKVDFKLYDRHTHPQFVYHKESFMQPTLRMSIEPEPVPEPQYIPEINQAAGQSGSGDTRVAQGSGNTSGDNQDTSESGGDGNASEQNGGSGSGGDGNEDGDGKKDESKEPADKTEGEEEEVQEKKQKKEPRTRRRRYEGPVEPLLIRDSVRYFHNY
jgi:Immunoglobulin I-set domain